MMPPSVIDAPDSHRSSSDDHDAVQLIDPGERAAMIEALCRRESLLQVRTVYQCG